MRDRKAVVAVEIAGAEERAVALEVGKPELMRAEHFQEAGRAAAMLDVGSAVGVHRGHVEAVAARDERGFVTGERVARGGVGDGLVSAKVSLLRGLDGGSEHELHEFCSHARECADFRGICAYFLLLLLCVFPPLKTS
jgi:hypothetical protein